MRGKSVGSYLWLFAVVAGLVRCTDTGLEALPPPPPPLADNKITVRGDVCTQAPEDLVFPLRVVFLVDCSESMEINDPVDFATQETGRQKAVRETIETLAASGQDVKVSVVRFSSESQPLLSELNDDGQFESYFTADLETAVFRLSLLAETDRTTNYVRALSEAYAEIRHELMHASQESLALTTYQVIMISDGLPDVEGDEVAENSAENILEAVEGIMELGRLFHINSMAVNTALISSGNALVDAAAQKLLTDMAEQGKGTFRSFASGGELNFLHIDLSALQRVFTLKTLLVQNINAKVIKDDVWPDSDGDGLADAYELAIGSDLYSPDADGDGCRDGVEYRYRTSGMDPIDPDDCQCLIPDYCFDENLDGLCDCGDDPPGSCCEDQDGDGLCDCIDVDADGICDPENYLDQDGDGLVDCEERYSGTNRRGADSDGDGLVDFLEFRFGTNPELNDVTDDLDWDAVANGEEVKTATDPHHTSAQGRSELAYRYNVKETALIGGRTCYHFDVDNISLTEMAPAPALPGTPGPAGQGYTGANRIMVFIGEVPFDDLESYARFQIACVEASFVAAGNYKNPPSGLIEIAPTDFVNLTEFIPAVHCRPPGG